MGNTVLPSMLQNYNYGTAGLVGHQIGELYLHSYSTAGLVGHQIGELYLQYGCLVRYHIEELSMDNMYTQILSWRCKCLFECYFILFF